jgi:hypothetical protein
MNKEQRDLAIYRAIVQSQTLSQFHIAKAIHLMFLNQLACQQVKDCRGKRVIWYERKSNEEPWKEVPDSYIRLKLSNDVAKRYARTIKWLFEKAIEDDEIIKLHWVDVANKLIKVSTMLGNNSFKLTIMREMVDLFEKK